MATATKLSRASTPPTSQTSPSTALEAVGARPRLAQRRPTKQASYELANHAKAYLEGGQVASGYGFLHSLLAAGTSVSTPAQPHLGILAPPAYIAFASSLVVDPLHTTQARSEDAQAGSDAALQYLQCIHGTIGGPSFLVVRQAFAFPAERNRRRGPAYRSTACSLSPGRPSDDVSRLAGAAPNEKSLWHLAEDFWHVIGWAFNCSVLHKKRWNRWKLWLAIMLDFLEADWDLAVKESKEAINPGKAVQASLLSHYIVGDAESTNRGMRRRIVKAILAMGTTESRHSYPEVWRRETIERKQKPLQDGPLNEVNFETGDIGDYESDEEVQDGLEEPGREDELSAFVSSHGPTTSNVLDACDRLGGRDAIELRQRFITLLAQVAETLPLQFTALGDFFDNILEDVRLLPIATFHVFISTITLRGPMKIAFFANLLLPLVSGSVPDYFRFHADPDHLETKFLPMKATTQSFAANAKISLIIEQVFLYMMSLDAINPTTRLRKVLEDGISARHGVYGTAKSKKGSAEEEFQSKEMMEASSSRLLGLLEILEIGAKSALPANSEMQNKDAKAPYIISFTSGSSLSSPPDLDAAGQ